MRACVLVVALAAAFVVHDSAAAGGAALPQTVSDADLVASSEGRTVRVRVQSAVVDIPVELYVARVLAGEGEPRAADAAQQALAIAIRTFAAANAGRHRREGFDLCDTTHCQVLRPASPASRAAALATAGQVLTYEGRPADVFYSASCGGRSEAAIELWPGATDHPYLRAADDEVHADETPWVVEVPLARAERALRRAGFAGRLKDVRIERRTPSGRAATLQLAGMRPDAIAGDDFRAAIGARELRSTAFEVRRAGAVLRFTGRGYGHGVGLCVVGASRRAARGEDVGAILEQYYPGLRIEPGFDATAAPPAAPAEEHAPEAEEAEAPPPSEAARIAMRAREQLSAALGLPSPPVLSIVAHDSLESFRRATGRPWWVGTHVNGTVVDVAPLPLLAQRDGVEAEIRRGVAAALVGPALAAKPAWVRVGAARHFAGLPQPSAKPARASCPTDAELLFAVSASAQRDADVRAQACFTRALTRTGNWRDVR